MSIANKVGTRTVSVLALLLVLGCKADTSGLSTLSVEELLGFLTQDPELVLCDANSAETRSRLGIIPGARLLSDYRKYAVAELPSELNRRIVFYCHSEYCGAAAAAARRAIADGHRDVHVLSAGIQGWIDAGRPIETLASDAKREGA